ncbi:hypothetical protein HanPSC8_Chr04g0144521 [Helianthus annuus]|nr:hypothetical protein HanPSC8_Chr04g0144521 [Helianthus annuus]
MLRWESMEGKLKGYEEACTKRAFEIRITRIFSIMNEVKRAQIESRSKDCTEEWSPSLDYVSYVVLFIMKVVNCFSKCQTFCIGVFM